MLKTLFLLTALTVKSVFVASQAVNPGCSAASNPWPASLHTGLVAWYPFNGNANDESGNGNNPDITGAALTTDRYGISNAAYHFDGTQYIVGNCKNYPTTTRTISFWYKGTDFTLNNDAFGYGGDGSCGTSWITIFANAVFAVAGHCSYFDTFADNALPLYNNWHNVIVSYDGSQIKIYSDGCTVASLAIDNIKTVVVAGKSFYIGAIPEQGGVNPYNNLIHHYWIGDLDDVAIWDRALSDEEVKIVAQPVCQPKIIIASNQGQVICENTSPVFSATIENYSGQVNYQWQVNNLSVGQNSTTYTNSSLANNDVVSCILLSATGCPLDTSNSLAMTVKTNQPLSITIKSDDADNSICSGSSITFTAAPLNAGVSPVYLWKVNGGNTGINSPTFNTSVLANNAVVSCQLTAGAAECVTGNPATSNSILVKVIPTQILSVNIAPDDADNIICNGATVNFTATSTNGGSSPDYQWKRNDFNAGVNDSFYSGNTFTDKDIIQCTLTSNAACVVPATASSNSIVLHIPAAIKLGRDTGFCMTDGLTLQVKDTFSAYKWSTGASTTSLSITQSGTYWVQAQDKYNCMSADTINVIEKYCGFAIPTAFTPNNDGRNDVFKPVLSGTVIMYSFIIYDRWGKKIFCTSNLAAGWDGYNKDQMELSGTYVWICEFQLAGQPMVLKKGSVVLIR